MKKSRNIAIVAAFACGLLAGPALALDPHLVSARDFAAASVERLLKDPVILRAIKAHNTRNARLSPSEIESLDIQWRLETGSRHRPMIDAVLKSELSKCLMRLRQAAGGRVTEILVMDARGMIVGVDHANSDYWQGDEEKWRKTFLAGPGSVFVDDVEHDPSTDAFQSEVSFAVTDPESGEVIGSITFGINIDRLASNET